MFQVNDPTASPSYDPTTVPTTPPADSKANPAYDLIVPIFWSSKIGFQTEKAAGDGDACVGGERLSCVLMVSWIDILGFEGGIEGGF